MMMDNDIVVYVPDGFDVDDIKVSLKLKDKKHRKKTKIDYGFLKKDGTFSSNISEDVLERYMSTNKNLCWDSILSYITLSEHFIIKHSDELDWSSVSRYQYLSESF